MTTGLWERFATACEPKPRKYTSPLTLAQHLDRKAGRTPALDLIDRELVELFDGDATHNALMVFCPPQEGKSQLCSRRLPEWLLEHDPGVRIAIVSYEAEKAQRWGRDIKNDIAMAPEGELAINLRADSKAAGRWETPEGGGVFSVGIGGPLTGNPVDVLIVDDPVKDRLAAESEAIRKHTWDWWENVALTRLAPGCKVVFIMTRWHEDDLAGRIMSRPSPLNWRKIILPAISTGKEDPLGRPAGVELPSVRGRAPGYFANLRATMSPYVFSSIYQQTPTAAEGNFYRRATFRYWRPAPPWPGDYRERIDCEGTLVTLADCWRFATVDVAGSTKTSADYTVISYWCVSPAGDLILLDRARNQVDTHDHFAMAQPMFQRWGEAPLWVEHGFFSTTLVKDAIDAGVPVAELTADTDKVTRAIPAAGRVHAGRVWFPAVTAGCPCGNCPDGQWLDEWADELASFPNGDHDDQADTLAYAVRVQIMEWSPAKTPPRPGVSQHDRAVADAARSATGHDGIDPMTVPW